MQGHGLWAGIEPGRQLQSYPVACTIILQLWRLLSSIVILAIGTYYMYPTASICVLGTHLEPLITLEMNVM